MTVDGLTIVSCDSSTTLMELYNKWTNKTMFMSCGNLQVKEWDELLVYANNNKRESAMFALEYLNDYESNWIILSFVSSIFGDPFDDVEHDGYIPPSAMCNIYKLHVSNILNDGKDIQ